MTIDEIKRILEREEGKVIVVEKGKPIMVIMGFEDYEKKITRQNLGGAKLVSFLPAQISEKLGAGENPKKEIPKELQEEELKIEDLPI